MNKQFLEKCLNLGMSTREIAKLPEVKIKNRTVLY